jgi:hypothetical protein
MVTQQDAAPGADVWARLETTRQYLALRSAGPEAGSSSVGVVGPLGAALPVVRRLRREAEAGCEVVVLSSRAELVCEPSWTLVRNGARLAEAIHRPGPALVLIDVAASLPAWVGPLVARLRRAGLGLVHYAHDGDPSDADLATARAVLGQPLVVDLAAPVEPDRLVELIDLGEPVASVRGRPLTAELVVAARASCRPS